MIFFAFFIFQFQQINNDKSIDMRLIFSIGFILEKKKKKQQFSWKSVKILIKNRLEKEEENRFRRKKKKKGSCGL